MILSYDNSEYIDLKEKKGVMHMSDNREFISAIRGYLRLGNFPLDASTVYESYEEAEAYAEYNPSAYAGQIVSVVDPIGKTVAVYKLNYSDEVGKNYELGPMGGGNGSGTVTADNVFYYDGRTLEQILDFLLDLLSGVSSDGSHVINKLKVDTNQISESNDVITRGYLESAINFNTIGVVKTIQVQVNHTGGKSDKTVKSQLIPRVSRIRRVTVEIIEEYEPDANINIILRNTDVSEPDEILVPSAEIVQDEKTLSIIDMNFLTGIYEYYIVVLIDNQESTSARAEVLVEYLDSPIRDTVDGLTPIEAGPVLVDGGQFLLTTFEEEDIDGGIFTEEPDETLDGGNF